MTALSFADAMQLFVVGLSQGCLYSLIAIGLVLVYKATEQVNFAQGEFMMLGAFVGYQFIVLMGMPYWLGAMLTLAFMGAFGYGVEALVVRRLTGQPVFTVFILTLALGIALRAVAGIIWGFGNYLLPAPVDGNLTLGPVIISWASVLSIVVTAVVASALYLFFRYARQGIAMQALSLNQLAAFYMGIPVKRLTSSIWAMSAIFGGIAGLLLGPMTLVSTQMGFIGFKAFAGAIVGGFGSIPGAVIGCLLIGVTEPFFDIMFPTLKGIGAYLIMFLVLLIRPQGLLAQIYAKKV
ncbi:branched-chain amino acid ABC transporter permease [Paracoccus albus]|uniref:branched-chain amino acid ABC transporter permease n=1 Tax=Paracoccus albus TaxID=3017784 RepID=UPI0022F08904|nr:branched-chain amino acid ABC transporter permease [Paracoccus albus]WBU62315.1 branched-chain amino acid ABC transporter permease [Paracoccus albus]